jgi:hypothetical protein
VLAVVEADVIGGREYREEMLVQLVSRRGVESAQAGKRRLTLVMQAAVGCYSIERDEYLLQVVQEVKVVVWLVPALATGCVHRFSPSLVPMIAQVTLPPSCSGA